MFRQRSPACRLFRLQDGACRRCAYIKNAIVPPTHPKIASSCATVAPALAARVAAILRTPWADPGTPAALQASLNRFPKLSFVSGSPRFPQIKDRSPHGPADSVSANTGRIGKETSRVNWLFSALMMATPLRTCWRQGEQHRRA
jgi:hypothetical protein